MADEIFDSVLADLDKAEAQPATPIDANAADPIFESLADEIGRDEQRQRAVSIMRQQAGDPEAYGETKMLATNFGVDIDFAARNKERLAKFQGFQDASRMFDNNGRLATFFVKDDNSSAIKMDELRQLDGLSWFYNAAVDAWGEGNADVDLANLSYKRLMGTASGDELSRLDQLSGGRQPRTFAADTWLEKSWVGAAKQMPIMGETLIGGIEQGIKGATYGGLIAAGAGQLGPQVALPEELVTVPAGAAMGFTYGSMAGQWVGSFRLEAGLAYDEFRNLKDENGRPMDDDVARGAAIVAGSASSLLETMGFRKLASIVPGLDRVTGTLGRDSIKAALARPTVRQALASFAKNVGTGVGVEVTTELAQEALTIFAGEVAKGYAGEDGAQFDMLDAGDIADRMGETFEQTLQAMTIMGPALATTRLGHDVRRAQAATRDMRIIEALGKSAEANELNVRLPDKAKEAIRELTKDGPVQHVYVAPEAFSTFFQTADEASQFAASIGLTDEYNESQRVGRDMEIPIDAYYVNIAGTEIGAAIQQFVKLSPDRMSMNEAESFNLEWQEAQEQLKAEYTAQQDGDTAALAGEEVIFEDVKNKALDAGMVPDQATQYAKLYSNFFRVMAQRSGQDAGSLYATYGLDVKRALPGEEARRAVDNLDLALEVVRAGKVDPLRKKVEKASGPSLLQQIIARGGIVDTGGELAGMDLPRGVVRAGEPIQAPRLEGIDDNAPAADLGDFNMYTADDTMRQMWEEGYFPEFEERPTPDALYEAMREEAAGRKRFSATKSKADDPGVAQARGLVEFADMLDKAGLDPATMTNDEIRAAIDEIANTDPDTGALYQFAGMQAETFDQEAYFKARAMLEAGEDREDVFRETGFFKGPDGKWRFEISDTEAAFKDGAIQPAAVEGVKRYAGTLGDLLKHDKLFAAYPQLRDMDVALIIKPRDPKSFSSGNTGSFNGELIQATGVDEKQARSVLLHEIAHAIQLEEDFAFGGNASLGEIYEGARVEFFQKELDGLISQWEEIAGKLDEATSNDARDVFDRRLKEIDEEIVATKQGLTRAAAFEYYNRLAGEVEARNVQTRDREQRMIDKGEADWAAILAEAGEEPSTDPKKTVDVPWWTQDVPEGKVIVVRVQKPGQSFEAMDGGGERELFQQEPGEAAKPAGVKRGSIQLAPGRTIINLFDQADMSTFLHESGHFFLEVFRDLAMQAEPGMEVGPQSSIIEDWRRVQEYLGIGDDGVISTEAHEKFARTFEAYLFEGKAPSDEVASIMARFRSWLAFVYKSVTALRVPINDKIRGVMDRMIATDQEIAAAQLGPEFRPAFKDAASAGMSEKQWADYTATAGRAVDRAKREMDARMMQEISRETTAEWREAKRAIRNEVLGQMERRPVYRAIRYLRTGEGEGVPEARLRMDRQAILDMFGEGALIRLPKGVPPLYVAKGGVHPDVIAELFGFKSGHDMVMQMMSVPNMGRAVTEEVDIRMRQKYGDLMGDAVARARVAQEAIATDATGELLNAELAVLVKKGLATSEVSAKQARALARDMIRSKTIREAIRTKLYMNANAKAAAEAERAILAGDWKAALSAKKRQLLNHYMAMESRQAEKDVEAAVKYLNKFNGRKKVQGVWQTHLDQIETLLSRFDLRRSTSLKTEQRRTSLAAWLAEQEALGEIVDVPEEIRDDAFRKSYRQMTPDDLLAVRDAVKNIEHLGRRWAKVYGDIEAREHRAKVDDLTSSVAASQPLTKEEKTRNPTRLDDLISGAWSLEAALLKMESVFDWMDRGKSNGPFRRLIWDRIAKAEERENDLRIKVVGEFERIMGGLDKARLNERISIPGFDKTYLRADIMAAALNMGNASNLDKMLRGEAWTRTMLDRLVSNLNADEAQAVQGIWDTVESLWPEIAAVQKRMAGTEPPKIEATPVEIAGVKLRGGYYPVMYDPRRSPEVADRKAAGDDVVRFENVYMRPETRHGFTKERAQAYAKPFLLDIGGAAKHLVAVIHDVTHREAILDANKLLTTPAVRAEIEARYGRELYGQFVPWLQSIAFDAYKNDGLSAADRLFRGIRSRATIVGMGFRFSTMFTQITGLSASAEMVNLKHLAGAIKDFTLSPRAYWDEVNAKSGLMRYRASNLDRDINERLKSLTGKTGLIDQATRFSFYGIGIMDRMVSIPTWMGAYREYLQGNPGDEAGAISHADKVISLSQGAGGPKDLPAVMRKNETTKLVTMFYSYFSAYYNRQRTWGRDMKKKITTGEGDYPSLLARQVFMTIGPAILGELLVGRGPDDDESWKAWMAKKIALYPFAAAPIIRDAIGYFDDGFGYTFTPASRVIEETIIAPFKLIGDAAEGDATLRQVVKQSLETTGYALALPTGQLSSTIDNVWKALEEDDFQLRDLVLSRPKK